MAFCRKATRSPTTASPNLMVHSPSLGGFPTPAKGRSTGSWWLSRRLTPTASTILMHLSMFVSPAFNGSCIQADSILLRFFSDCVLMRSCGSDCNIRMWSVSLDSTPTLPPFPLYTLGCPTGACLIGCVITATLINSVWYVVASGKVVNHSDDSDYLLN